MTRQEVLAKINALTSKPIAFQALWDGNSSGWMVRMSVVTTDMRTHFLGTLRFGGDIRIFNGDVPPWPEAAMAQELGNELAVRFDAEFYFPSPKNPEDECPAWFERANGYPCRHCGILLWQRDHCPWRGVCFHCHLEEDRQQREAKWTAEKGASQRCHICGNPATQELNGGPACAECFNKYESYTCARCGGVTTLLNTYGRSEICSSCELQDAINSLSAEQRDSIRNALEKGQLWGVKVAKEVMKCSLLTAKRAVYQLSASNADGP
jgi:hypothetical protein